MNIVLLFINVLFGVDKSDEGKFTRNVAATRVLIRIQSIHEVLMVNIMSTGIAIKYLKLTKT